MVSPVQNVLQSTYTDRPAIGAAGMVASEYGPPQGDTKICESAEIGFGVAVVEGAGDRGVLLPGDASGGGAFVGISKRDVTLRAGQDDAFVEGQNMGVHSVGDIWVVVKDTVVKGDAATYDTTTGQLGSGGTSIPGSRYMTSADADGLAVVRITHSPDGA